MRLKIIALFSSIVIMVGGLAYGLSRATLAGVGADPSAAPRALSAAVAQLQVEGFATERWIAARAGEPSMREPFTAGTPDARADQATAVANRIADASASAHELLGIRPSFVALVDASGKVLGRDRSTLMRGDDLAKAYPALRASLDSAIPGTDVWVSRDRNESLLASFAPIRGEDGKVVGALVFASLLNDERLGTASERTSGQALVVVVGGDKGIDVVARSPQVDEAISAALAQGAAAEGAKRALGSRERVDLEGFPPGYVARARSLEGYGDGKRAAVIAVAKPSALEPGRALLWPTIGASLLGILLVGVAGTMLHAYYARPIGEIEDGLLAIMNGQTNQRLQIEHEDLGGVVFRINSLLNQLFGVSEETDEEGRVAPAANPPAPAPSAPDAASKPDDEA
jgi:hypothetical protein